jgi:hypothetical protein
MSPPYLNDPPKVIPIDVGRQLLVDDFLVETNSFKRTFHRATNHAVNPVIRADHPWETGGKSTFVAPYHGAVLYDPRDQLFKICYKMGLTGDYLCEAVGYAVSRDNIRW